jgi:hypothetical protein
MISFLTDITRFFKNFELLPILKKFLFLVMTVILDTGRRWRTQIWKGTTQTPFQQSLVEIDSVVSEEKIFFKFHSLFFLLFFMNFELLPILRDYSN